MFNYIGILVFNLYNIYVFEKYYVVIKKKGKGLYMIRVKFGYDDWIFLKYFRCIKSVKSLWYEIYILLS